MPVVRQPVLRRHLPKLRGHKPTIRQQAQPVSSYRDNMPCDGRDPKNDSDSRYMFWNQSLKNA